MTSLLAVSPVVRDLHVGNAWVVVVGNGLAGAWALAAHRWERLRHPALWWATAAVEVDVFVQVVLGVLLLQDRERQDYQFHMFYGFVAAFTVAIVYSYRAQLAAHRYLLYGCGGLFLMGLGIRAMVLHPG
jgi:hypothetical protein